MQRGLWVSLRSFRGIKRHGFTRLISSTLNNTGTDLTKFKMHKGGKEEKLWKLRTKEKQLILGRKWFLVPCLRGVWWGKGPTYGYLHKNWSMKSSWFYLNSLTSCKHINALSQFLPVVDLEEGPSPPPNFWVKLRPTRPRKIFSRQAGSEFTQPSYPQLLTDLTLRGPYSFFLRVVSWARKPDGILAWLQVGLPRQNCRIIKEWWKNCVQLEHFSC